MGYIYSIAQDIPVDISHGSLLTAECQTTKHLPWLSIFASDVVKSRDSIQFQFVVDVVEMVLDHCPRSPLPRAILLHTIASICRMLRDHNRAFYNTTWLNTNLFLEKESSEFTDSWDIVALICAAWFVSIRPLNYSLMEDCPPYFSPYVESLREAGDALYDFPSILRNDATLEFARAHSEDISITVVEDNENSMTIVRMDDKSDSEEYIWTRIGGTTFFTMKGLKVMLDVDVTNPHILVSPVSAGVLPGITVMDGSAMSTYVLKYHRGAVQEAMSYYHAGVEDIRKLDDEEDIRMLSDG